MSAERRAEGEREGELRKDVTVQTRDLLRMFGSRAAMAGAPGMNPASLFAMSATPASGGGGGGLFGGGGGGVPSLGSLMSWN